MKSLQDEEEEETEVAVIDVGMFSVKVSILLIQSEN